MIPDTKKIEPINIHKNPNNHLQRHSRCSTPSARDAEKHADEQREPEKITCFKSKVITSKSAQDT